MIALVYGGSGSGKSQLAESLLSAWRGRASALVYVATMFPGDREARERIRRHQSNRTHKGFATLELFTNLGRAAIPKGAAVLLECLGNLVANEMFSPDGAGAEAGAAVLEGLEAVANRAARIIVVSNDVASDGRIYSRETEEYRRLLAELNREIAARSAVVAETVCGIPLWHRRSGSWESERFSKDQS